MDSQRYTRHFSLPEIGEAGQRKLAAAKILCIGAGGLASPALLYLAAAGLGTIGIVDDDVVALSNLQRQILHSTDTLAQKKTTSARESIHRLNPDVCVHLHDERFMPDNAAALAAGYDILIDASDNFAARYLCGDVCRELRIPDIYGSVEGFCGQLTVFAPQPGAPTYRDLFPAGQEEEPVAGVLGMVPGIIGTLQAIEAVKLILGIGTPLIGQMLHFNALTMHFRKIAIGVRGE